MSHHKGQRSRSNDVNNSQLGTRGRRSGLLVERDLSRDDDGMEKVDDYFNNTEIHHSDFSAERPKKIVQLGGFAASPSGLRRTRSAGYDDILAIAKRKHSARSDSSERDPTLSTLMASNLNKRVRNERSERLLERWRNNDQPVDSDVPKNILADLDHGDLRLQKDAGDRKEVKDDHTRPDEFSHGKTELENGPLGSDHYQHKRLPEGIAPYAPYPFPYPFFQYPYQYPSSNLPFPMGVGPQGIPPGVSQAIPVIPSYTLPTVSQEPPVIESSTPAPKRVSRLSDVFNEMLDNPSSVAEQPAKLTYEEILKDSPEMNSVLTTVNNYTTDRREVRKVSVAPKDYQFRDLQGGCSVATLYNNDNSFMVGGIVKLKPGSIKPTRASKENAYIFYVIQGSVEVFIGENEFEVHGGGSFEIPRGNTYSLRNTSQVEVNLFFVQAQASG